MYVHDIHTEGKMNIELNTHSVNLKGDIYGLALEMKTP